jgi:ribosomal peptide maturation radical SAM protein 1
MYKIALVNMPFGHLAMPSIALTQLQSVTAQAFRDQAGVQVHYLNHDFAHYLGLVAYEELVSFDHHPTGLGEWFFRPVAFPDAPDNSEAYFQRYYPQHNARNRMIKGFVLQKQAGLRAHFEKMAERYGLYDADVVGFTSMFSQNVSTIGMARVLKARNPRQVVVMGGANCEGVMGRQVVDNLPMIDFVFSGPSLKSFPRLVRSLMEGDEAGCHVIDGVFSRKNRVQFAGCGPEGGRVEPGAAPAVKAFGEELDVNVPVDLEYTPFLDRYEAAFPGASQPILFFETSRGCWWGERAHCTFCGLNGSTIGYRAMKPELAFRVLGSLFQYSDRCSRIDSVDNILPKSYLTDVLPFLDTPPNMEIFYEVKADLSEDDFRVLEKSRVTLIQPGIESLNTSTLKLMRKGTSVFQNVQFLINALRYNISPAWNLLIGFPNEKLDVYEKYLEDIPLLTHLPPPGGVFPVRFDRFSPYFEEADEYGLELHPLDWYGLTYPLPGEALKHLAYYFMDRNYHAEYALNAARMVGRLREMVNGWIATWSSPETRARLVMVPHGSDAGAAIHDSRSGTAVEYDVSPESRILLEALATPRKPSALVKELDLDLDAEIAVLREHRLVLSEGDRLMSLVVPPRTDIGAPPVDTGTLAAVA